MLTKAKRVPRSLFSALLQSRLYRNSPHFTIRIGEGEGVRAAVTVSKKVSKKAVIRNKVRRRCYSVLAKEMQFIPKGLYLVVAKAGADKLEYRELETELAQLLKKS